MTDRAVVPRSLSGRASVAVAVAALRVYRAVLSPILAPACRFAPSCSRYAEEAVARHGVMSGARLSIARVLRCHPWSRGGYDPVPERLEG